MSRCFPFPPSGYEKKARTENVDFLTKEKHKEKQHKKEKRNKEKREHKEKREKDRSKDKHKEKKDKKEKQKERKKEDDRDKGRTSEEKRAEGQIEGVNELHIRESWQKDEQRKDFKFAEELGRTGDDRATNPMDGSFSNSVQRKNGRMGAAIASQEKERVADIKVFPVQISSAQRRNDLSGLPIEKMDFKFAEELCRTGDDRATNPMDGSFSNSVQRKNGRMGAAIASQEKERVADIKVLPVQISSAQRRNDLSGLPIEKMDFKFAEELGRTGDDRATNPMDGSFSNSVQRKNGRMGAAIASQEKERVADIKVFPVQISSAQRRSDLSGLSIENVASSIQRRTVFTSPATALEKERSKMHEKVTVGSGIEQNRNHGVCQPVESISVLFNRKTEGSTAGMEKEKFSEKVVSKSIIPGFERGKLGAKIMDSSSFTATQIKDVLGLSVGNLSSVHSKTEDMTNPSIRRMEGMDTVPAIEKERTRGGEIFPNPVTSEQRRNTKIGKPVEKDRYEKVENKDKNVVKKAEDRNGHKDLERDHSDMWSKVKDKHTKEKKKEEKIEEKAEVEHIELRNFGKKDQVDTVNSKPLAPQKDNTAGTIGINEILRKRKDLQTNGYLHKEDARPDKIPRMASSFQAMNGRAVELPLAAPTSLFLKSGDLNTLKPDRMLENNENKINGTTKSWQLPLEVKPMAVGGLIENCEVSMELPHPDSKYLSQIYTVPELMEWSVIDDQDWLFNCCDSQHKPKAETEAQEAIHVWAEGLRIDSAGVFALPYVVPF